MQQLAALMLKVYLMNDNFGECSYFANISQHLLTTTELLTWFKWYAIIYITETFYDFYLLGNTWQKRTQIYSSMSCLYYVDTG